MHALGCDDPAMSDPADKNCFFISPIGPEGSDIRRRSDIVKKHILEAALVPGIVGRVERADEHDNPGEITPTIVAAILEADLVVADVTGANPNVYYELAIAHAYDKPTVHIRKAGEPLPFDIKDVRVIEYGLDLDTGDRARELIAGAASYAFEHPEVVRTPVSGGTTLYVATQSGDATENLVAEVLRRLDEFEGILRHNTAPPPARARNVDDLQDEYLRLEQLQAEAAVAQHRFERLSDAVNDLAHDLTNSPGDAGVETLYAMNRDQLGAVTAERDAALQRVAQAESALRHPSRHGRSRPRHDAPTNGS